MTQAKAKKLSQSLQSYRVRCEKVSAWIDSQTPESINQFLIQHDLPSLHILREDLVQEPYPYVGKYSIHELWDSCGPAISNPEYTAITCSEESQAGCEYINSKREEINHKPLHFYLSPLIMDDGGQKMSSTALRAAMK